ncbi:hypothetical protein RST01_30690 [Rummeliibacillus stabekisii]|nr:hypothetical protein RST01_30690 [Rummeliibacillus stabekisii]
MKKIIIAIPKRIAANTIHITSITRKQLRKLCFIVTAIFLATFKFIGKKYKENKKPTENNIHK